MCGDYEVVVVRRVLKDLRARSSSDRVSRVPSGVLRVSGKFEVDSLVKKDLGKEPVRGGVPNSESRDVEQVGKYRRRR